VKLYADEPGHETVRRLPAPLVISALARVEVAAAISRKHRTGELGLDDFVTLLRAFQVDYGGTPEHSGRFLVVTVADGILERGAELAGAHGLRAYDAVQLASALSVREADERCDTFAAFDRDLSRAAVTEGFNALPTDATTMAQPPRPQRGSTRR
jgi:predicted nucleic acid-binding protein